MTLDSKDYLSLKLVEQWLCHCKMACIKLIALSHIFHSRACHSSECTGSARLTSFHMLVDLPLVLYCQYSRAQIRNPKPRATHKIQVEFKGSRIDRVSPES